MKVQDLNEQRPAPFLIVDAQGCVRYASLEAHAEGGLSPMMAGPERLRPEMEGLVAEAVTRGETTEIRGALVAEERFLRIAPLIGEGETMLMLSLEEDRSRSCLRRAAGRFRLTRRETAVLAELLNGSSAAEIAAELIISENTVMGYVKRLLSKTLSRNRSAMLAKVLDWSATTEPSAPRTY